jgi:hypothetical protein
MGMDPWEDAAHSHQLWRDSYAANKGQSLADLLPRPPEPAIVPPAPTSQAVDTLAVTEYREPEQDLDTYTAAEMVTMLVIGLALGAIGVWHYAGNMVSP